jgi:A/G-specific adenine glycosylase
MCKVSRIRFPLPAKKTEYEDLVETAVVIRRGSKYLIRECQPGERWAGLWDFPRYASVAATHETWFEQSREHLQTWLGVAIEPREHLATTKHGVTRFRITLHVLTADWLAGGVNGNQKAQPRTRTTRWVSRSELADLPLSVTGRKIAGMLAQALRRSR